MRFSFIFIMILCPLLGQLACQGAKWGARQDQTAPPSGNEALSGPYLETLAAVMPHGWVVVSQEQLTDGEAGQAEIEVNTSAGAKRLRVDSEGFPLRIIEDLDPEEVPAPVREKAPRESDAGLIERRWIMLYELEIRHEEQGEIAVFVDGAGRELFQLVENEENEDSEEEENGEGPEGPAETLPARVLERVKPYLRGAERYHLEREKEWGRTLYEIEWREKGQTREIKIFSTGEVLLQELPASHPIPERVRALPTDEPPEAVLLAVYCQTGASDSGCWLADGASFPLSQ